MADTYGGLGGLFGGFTNGLQMLIALQQAAENQRIRREELGVSKNREAREQHGADVAEANAPYEDVQTQLNKQNITAPLPDIRREFTPPNIGDTFQPTTQFTLPKFGAAPHVGDNKPAVPDLNTSHIAQVLERARRESTFQRSQSVLTDVLAAAGQRAQATQQPVAGAFPDKTGELAELPSGFTATPDKTFSPYQLGQGNSKFLDRLATNMRLLRARIPAPALQLLDLGIVKPGEIAKIYKGAQADIQHYIELQAQYEQLIGAVNPGGGQGQLDTGPSGGAPKDRNQIINAVIQAHPNWTDQQVADEVDRQMQAP